LLDGSHQNFLSHVKAGKSGNSRSTHTDSGEPSPQLDKDFLGLQQFARGEISLFGSCGKKHPTIALDAYRKALQIGLPDKTYTAEAHHRMGLAFKSLGKLNEAKSTLEQALSFEPYSATMLNSYGTVLTELHQLPQAITAYEQALALKPDYANARFNLAEACEGVNPKRAIQEYETYLILAEDQPQEASKVQVAKEKLQSLQRGH
ncbi:MAG: tetratricopeptide repeat protein, partial [Nitrospirales bacterium]|nr:tetratricopeptide repeat protein [Nitrospirales bacterium]